MICMPGNAVGGTCPGLMTPCTVAGAVVASGKTGVGPVSIGLGLGMDEVTGIAGPRLIGRFPMHIDDLGSRPPQVMETAGEPAGLRMAGEAQVGFLPAAAKELCRLRLPVDIMARAA